MKEPPPLPPRRQRPPDHRREVQHGDTEHHEDPIHPAVLAGALLAIVLIALIIIWLLTTLASSASNIAGNSSQQTSGVSSNEPETVELGTDTDDEQGTHDSNEADSPEVSEDASDAAQPETGAGAAGDDEIESPPPAKTATETSSNEEDENFRVRTFNGGASKKISANGTNPFLIGTETGSTVFVIDKSSSMAGTAFESVQNSLLQAIHSLNASQRFSVIFFDDGPQVMPPKHKVKADEAGKAGAMAFITKMAPNGGTNPYSATRMALDMNPDAVVVLSDGNFDITEVERITRENQMNKKTPIHCIGLQTHIITLQKLAEDNAGTYRTAITPR